MRFLQGWRVPLVALLAVAFAAVAALPAGATVSSTNGKIVYGQVFPNYGVTINPDGSDPHQVGPVGSTTCNTWSPDSSKVLCNLWSPEGVQPGVQPATANPDGSGFTLLKSNLLLDLFCLNWSPTGARLLCHSEGMANPADAGLYTVRASDAGAIVRVSTQLPGSGIGDIGYGYSPNGSRILYAQFDSNDNGTLFSVKPDGTDPIQLSPSELSVVDLGFFDRVGADWSPDGSRVAFAAFNGSNHFITAALYVVNADGTGLHQIMPPGLGALSAQWSPNGAQIAFTSCPSRSLRTCGIPQAWVVRPDGSGLRQVTPPVSRALFLTPVWSPDGTKLLLNRFDQATGQTSLWTVNVNGSGLFKLADTVSLSLYDWGSAPAN